MKNTYLGIVVVALATVVGQSAFAAEGRDLLSIAKSKPQFSTLTKVIDAAGLADALQTGKGFTLFAPTNDAFAKLPAADLEMLVKPENKDKLVAVLTHHLVEGKGRTAEELRRKRQFRSLQGSAINMALVRGDLFADGAKVGREIDASNGTLYAVDSVMMPN
jgi:uncharacterized surface protein with fasciclin (FAS1) repeats